MRFLMWVLFRCFMNSGLLANLSEQFSVVDIMKDTRNYPHTESSDYGTHHPFLHDTTINHIKYHLRMNYSIE